MGIQQGLRMLCLCQDVVQGSIVLPLGILMLSIRMLLIFRLNHLVLCKWLWWYFFALADGVVE